MRKKILILACLAIVVMLYVFNPVEHRLMPKCPFKLLTGLSCPGCGFQRAAHAFLHGHFLEAWSYNYWLAFALPYLTALIVARMLPQGNVREQTISILEHRMVIYTYIVTFFAWGIIRNLCHI